MKCLQGLHKYKLRTMFNAVDMRWDWPVDANYHEAHAYCSWKTEQDGSVVRWVGPVCLVDV